MLPPSYDTTTLRRSPPPHLCRNHWQCMGMPLEGLERERRAREGGDSTLSSENAISDLGIGLGSGSAFSLSPGRGLDEQGDPFSNLTLSLQIKAVIGQRSEMCPSSSGISGI